MEHTEHFNLNMPQPSDKVDIEKISENFETIDQPLYNGQTTYEFAQSLTDPEYVGTRPTINVDDLNVEGTAFFAAGAGATFTPSAQLQVRTADPVSAGKIMVADANNVVKQSNLGVADVSASKDVTEAITTSSYFDNRPHVYFTDASFSGGTCKFGNENITIAPSSLITLSSQLDNSDGDIIFRTAQKYIQPSTLSIAEAKNAASVAGAITDGGTVAVSDSCTMDIADGASIIINGAPSSYDGNVIIRDTHDRIKVSEIKTQDLRKKPYLSFICEGIGNSTIFKGMAAMYSTYGILTPNPGTSQVFLGISLNDQTQNGDAELVTQGITDVFVHKSAGDTYSPAYGLCLGSWSTGGTYNIAFRAATNMSDYGTLTTYARPRIFLLDPNDYANMTDDSYALLKAVVTY